MREALQGNEKAYLLIINTPNECVIGGERHQVEAVAHETGGHFFPLRGVTTVHCEVADPVKKAYRDLHDLRHDSRATQISHYRLVDFQRRDPAGGVSTRAFDSGSAAYLRPGE